MSEKQNLERKEIWKDDYLQWVCGFANAQGGKIYIGIDDDGNVVGLKNAKKLLEDLPNKIKDTLGIVADINYCGKPGEDYIEIVIPAYPQCISYKGIYYYRTGSTNQILNGAALQEFLNRKSGISWDANPVLQLKTEQLSQSAIDLFIKKAIQKERLDSDISKESRESLIERLRLYKDEHLTNAAALLFYDDPERFVFGSYIKIGYFETDSEIIYQDEIHGSLMHQVDETMEMLYKKYLKAKISYEGIQRKERYPFPKDAVREALLNAIVHKDYTSGTPIQISVYDDKMFIANDGKLPQDWTIEDLMGKHKSKPYNPLIAHVFYLAGHVESWGRGVEKIWEVCKEDGIHQPEYTIHPGDIMIKFSAPEDRIIRTGTRVTEEVTDGVTDKVTDKEEMIFKLIQKNPDITYQEMVNELKTSRKTVSKYVKILKEKGLIRRVGSDRQGSWEIIK